MNSQTAIACLPTNRGPDQIEQRVVDNSTHSTEIVRCDRAGHCVRHAKRPTLGKCGRRPPAKALVAARLRSSVKSSNAALR
jgi:hypothetical protein